MSLNKITKVITFQVLLGRAYFGKKRRMFGESSTKVGKKAFKIDRKMYNFLFHV